LQLPQEQWKEASKAIFPLICSSPMRLNRARARL
jgi:hypothetical protein